jgi:phosphopantothenoylcysteine decarboxylase/phosphopantothenate--cysteine ligase
VVGFAAETGDLILNARKKLKDKGLDLIVANDVSEPGAGFDVETNIVRFISPDGRIEEPGLMGKESVADLLLDRVAALRR